MTDPPTNEVSRLWTENVNDIHVLKLHLKRQSDVLKTELSECTKGEVTSEGGPKEQ